MARSAKVRTPPSRRAEAAGAAMVMIMPPFFGATLRVSEAGIYDFFRKVSDAIGIPIMIQDAPMAGTSLSAPFLARMAKEIANVSYFKIEIAGTAAKLRDLIALGQDAIEGPWDGEEAITLMADLDAGAVAAVAVLVAWFLFARKHPDNAAPHAEQSHAAFARDVDVGGGRPAGPGAEADGVAGPGEPVPGPSPEAEDR